MECEWACPTPPLWIEFIVATEGCGLIPAAVQPFWRRPWASRGWVPANTEFAKLSPRELCLKRNDGRGHVGSTRHGRRDP